LLTLTLKIIYLLIEVDELKGALEIWQNFEAAVINGANSLFLMYI